VPTLRDEYAYLRRSTFTRQSQAEAELRQVISLLGLVPKNDSRRRQIGQAIHDATLRGGALDAEAVRRKVDARRDPSQPTPTVAQWCEEFMAKQGHIRPGTRVGFQRRLRHYIVPALGDIPLDALTAVHVRELFDAMDRRAGGESLDNDPPDQRRRKSALGRPLQHQVLNLLRSIIEGVRDAPCAGR
jgi:hypothetical protein